MELAAYAIARASLVDVLLAIAIGLLLGALIIWTLDDDDS